jgi:ABC-type dipeptide/oligopeptide/nickel transport system permease component
MLAYIVRRILAMIPMLLVISFISFVIIQLPPGDFLNTLQAAQGTAAAACPMKPPICCEHDMAWTNPS